MFFVTVAYDCSEFVIWMTKVGNVVNSFEKHSTIPTSLEDGIRWILQTSPSQFVCVDNDKTLKFYDFVDKKAQEEEKAAAKAL